MHRVLSPVRPGRTVDKDSQSSGQPGRLESHPSLSASDARSKSMRRMLLLRSRMPHGQEPARLTHAHKPNAALASLSSFFCNSISTWRMAKSRKNRHHHKVRPRGHSSSTPAGDLPSHQYTMRSAGRYSVMMTYAQPTARDGGAAYPGSLHLTPPASLHPSTSPALVRR